MHRFVLAIVALAAHQSFSLGLANYCLCALIFPRFSFPALAGTEMTWFVLWIFAPALFAPSAPPPAETVEDEQPWLAIPQSEPVITVTLPSGRTIVLERQSLAQSVSAFGLAGASSHEANYMLALQQCGPLVAVA